MEEKSSLLRQLRVDREAPARPRNRQRSSWRWLSFGIVVLGALPVGWISFSARDGIPVRAAIAQEPPTSSSVGSNSLLDASGYIVAKRQATVSAKVTGKLLEVLVDEGQRVEKNQVIARIDDSNALATLEQAKASLEQAKANLAAAKVALADNLPTYLRNKQQVAEGLITSEAFETSRASYNAKQSQLNVAQQQVAVADANLLSSQRNEDDYTVRAPFGGVITTKNAQPGETISPLATGGFTRTGIATLVDMDSLEIEVDVSESFINRIHAGQAATATLNAYPDRRIPATVIAMIPTADQSTATVKVRLGFKEKDSRILPHMGIRVSFLDDASAATDAPSGVIVPVEAVQATGNVGVVFEIAGDIVKQRPVRLGARTPNGQMILSGLSSGERIAIGDFGKLMDGAKIRVEK